MNGSSEPFPVVACIVFAAFSLAIFGRFARELFRSGGLVRKDLFGLPELLSSIVLVGFFLWIIAQGVAASSDEHPKPVSISQVLPSAFFFVILSGGIAVFLKYRGFSMRETLGLNRLPLGRAAAWALGLICAAFPIILAGNLVMQALLPEVSREQEMVTLFRDAARGANHSGIAQIVFAGAIIAPLCEEFLFRGFFYPVGKRYLGPVSSALLTSALFAAFHLNLAALPSLFLLAIFFNIAYEKTGSLLVPIGMHALFNGSQLGLLYYLAKHGLPA